MYGSPVYQLYNKLHVTHTSDKATPLRNVNGTQFGGMRNGAGSKLSIVAAASNNVSNLTALRKEMRASQKIVWSNGTDAVATAATPKLSRLEQLAANENEGITLPGSPIPIHVVKSRTKDALETQQQRLDRVEELLHRAKSEVK